MTPVDAGLHGAMMAWREERSVAATKCEPWASGNCSNFRAPMLRNAIGLPIDILPRSALA